jgi:DNA-binding response OmpR family regulator
LAAQIRGRVPVLGLTASHIAARQFEVINVPVVTKPFAMAELEDAIEDTVRERKTAGAWGW